MLTQQAWPNGRLARVAILCDFAEEHWLSMDMVAEMLLDNLRRDHACAVSAIPVRPRFVRRLTRPGSPRKLALNADRLLNRMFDYPRYVRQIRDCFDLFHVVDHSYSHLVRELPPGRTAVSCHDLCTFRCVLEPEAEPRSRPFRLMTQRILTGLAQAGRVACDSEATRSDLLRHGLVFLERTAVIPNGVAAVYSAESDSAAELEAARMLGPVDATLELLNVGSTIPRKRVDLLLRIFSAVREQWQGIRVRLIRVGGRMTARQRQLAQTLGVWNSIVELPFLTRRTLAAVYRRATLLLCPSEIEGFGLPLLEAMACGTPVIASDLPALREVGCDAVTYAPVGDVGRWTAAVLELLDEMHERHSRWTLRRQAAIERARMFSWRTYTSRTVELYGEMLSLPSCRRGERLAGSANRYQASGAPSTV